MITGFMPSLQRTTHPCLLFQLALINVLTEKSHLLCMERRQAVPAEVLLPHARLQRPERVADHVSGPRPRGPLGCHAAPDRVEAVPFVILLHKSGIGRHS